MRFGNRNCVGLIVLMVAMAGGAALVLSGCGRGNAASAEGGSKTLYTCGMHPQVVQDHPGNCPICGMKLTPIRKGAEERGEGESGKRGMGEMGEGESRT